VVLSMGIFGPPTRNLRLKSFRIENLCSYYGGSAR
jgi:hypothetical protein